MNTTDFQNTDQSYGGLSNTGKGLLFVDSCEACVEKLKTDLLA
jgi:hypothetical protein